VESVKVRSAPLTVDFVWTESSESMGQARDTADPLGFRAAAVRVARRLVPALTQRSFRTRGFALACFGLDASCRPPWLADEGERDVTFLRFEHLVVYAQCGHYPEGTFPDHVRYAGTRRAYARLRGATELDLNRSLFLNDDLSGGLWGAYRRPALQLGLLRPWSNHSSNPAFTELTALGLELAKAIENSAVQFPTKTRKLVRNRTLWTTPEDAAELIVSDTGTPTGHELDVLSRTLGVYDTRSAEKGKGRPFASLRKAFDDNGGNLALDSLDRSALTEGQAQALDDAQALVALMDAVEKPYRLWVNGERVDFPQSVAQHPGWAIVRLMGEPELSRLAMDLNAEPTLDAVHRHQKLLATDRGREPWESDEPRLGREEMLLPDFTLGSMARLFGEGISPKLNGPL
jgi:hypothetical protein